MTAHRALLVIVVAAMVLTLRTSARAFDVVVSTEGEYADAYLVNGNAFPPARALNTPDPANPTSLVGKPPFAGRHLNGAMCFFPYGFHHNGQWVMADDTYRESCLDTATPQARCTVTHRSNKFFVGKDADGWAVMKHNGKWSKHHIHTAWPAIATAPLGMGAPQPEPQGNIDPQGCFFDAQGNLWGNDVGSGDPTDTDPTHRGSLLVFFPGPLKKYDTYCFLEKDFHQAGMPAMDEAGNIYMAETGLARMWKFSPPFPSSEADCDNLEHLVTTPPTKTIFPTPGAVTPGTIVRVPGTDHWYIDSVFLPFTPGMGGVLVRNIVQNVPPGTLRNPLGMGVGSDGTLYYSELNLNADFSTGCGRVSMVRFVGGAPQPPQVLGQNLLFPDGVTVIDSSQLHVNFAKLPPAPQRDASACNGEGSPSGAFVD
jgi:hypothetical protein